MILQLNNQTLTTQFITVENKNYAIPPKHSYLLPVSDDFVIPKHRYLLLSIVKSKQQNQNKPTKPTTKPAIKEKK